jgi:maternal protein exuperantia
MALDLNHGAKKRHHGGINNVGCFRLLKCMKNYKVIKIKTNVAAVMDFLNWLVKTNEKKDGIILLFLGKSKLASYMLIESMKKFNLYEQFDKIIEAFVDG